MGILYWSIRRDNSKFGLKLLNIVGHFYHGQFIFKCSCIQITMVMRSGNVSFQGSSRFILLLTDWTIVIAVKVCLNVVPHLRFIFVSSWANVAAVKDPLAIFSHNPIHPPLNFFVQIQIKDVLWKQVRIYEQQQKFDFFRSWRHLHLGVDWIKRLLEGSLIVVGASHVLQHSLPSIDRVVTEEALVDQSFRVLSFYVASYIRCILRLVSTECANNHFFAFFIKCSAHEGLYLLKNS